MNIQDQFNEMTKALANNRADTMDGAVYAYVTMQLQNIIDQGLDPMDYEVILASDEFPRIVEDTDGHTVKINQYIRVVRREGIPRE